MFREEALHMFHYGFKLVSGRSFKHVSFHYSPIPQLMLHVQDLTLAYYINMATGKWMEVLCKVVKRLRDHVVLKRAGMMASPSSSDVASLKLDDPRVAYDNALAARSWKLVACILSERASTMARHTHTPSPTLSRRWRRRTKSR